MINQDTLNKLEEKYGEMSHIIIYPDSSGCIEDNNHAQIISFYGLERLNEILFIEE